MTHPTPPPKPPHKSAINLSDTEKTKSTPDSDKEKKQLDEKPKPFSKEPEGKEKQTSQKVKEQKTTVEKKSSIRELPWVQTQWRYCLAYCQNGFPFSPNTVLLSFAMAIVMVLAFFIELDLRSLFQNLNLAVSSDTISYYCPLIPITIGLFALLGFSVSLLTIIFFATFAFLIRLEALGVSGDLMHWFGINSQFAFPFLNILLGALAASLVLRKRFWPVLPVKAQSRLILTSQWLHIIISASLMWAAFYGAIILWNIALSIFSGNVVNVQEMILDSLPIVGIDFALTLSLVFFALPLRWVLYPFFVGVKPLKPIKMIA